MTEVQPKTIPTAVCEVFHFSDGNIHRLKPDSNFISKSSNEHKVGANQMETNSTHDNSKHRGFGSAFSKASTSSVEKRLNFLSTMQKYYRNQSLMYASLPTKLPNIHGHRSRQLASTQRQTRSSPAKIVQSNTPANSNASDSPSDFTFINRALNGSKSEIDYDELRSKMATRGASSRSSLQMSESDSSSPEPDDKQECTHPAVSSPWPPEGDEKPSSPVPATSDKDHPLEYSSTQIASNGNPPHQEKTIRDPFDLTNFQMSRSFRESLQIYHMTRSRTKKLKKPQHSETGSDVTTTDKSESIGNLSLTAHKVQGVNTKVVTQRNRPDRQMCHSPNQGIDHKEAPKKTNTVSPETKKLPALPKPAVSRTVSSISEEHTMFIGSYYDQFSHRKLKKSVTPGERKRSRAQANNLISKQYNQSDAKQYINVKIGRMTHSSVQEDRDFERNEFPDDLIPINNDTTTNDRKESNPKEDEMMNL